MQPAAKPALTTVARRCPSGAPRPAATGAASSSSPRSAACSGGASSSAFWEAATRELFAAGGIRYSEQDIEKSSSAAEGHRRLGGNGVPLIVVGDEIIHGYDEARLRRLLRHWLKRG